MTEQSLTTEKVVKVLNALDRRADAVALRKNGRNFARTLRVVVSEVRLELDLKEPRV